MKKVVSNKAECNKGRRENPTSIQVVQSYRHECYKLTKEVAWTHTDIINPLLDVTQCHLTVTLKAYLRLMWSSGSTGAMT